MVIQYTRPNLDMDIRTHSSNIILGRSWRHMRRAGLSIGRLLGEMNRCGRRGSIMIMRLYVPLQHLLFYLCFVVGS